VLLGWITHAQGAERRRPGAYGAPAEVLRGHKTDAFGFTCITG